MCTIEIGDTGTQRQLFKAFDLTDSQSHPIQAAQGFKYKQGKEILFCLPKTFGEPVKRNYWRKDGALVFAPTGKRWGSSLKAKFIRGKTLVELLEKKEEGNQYIYRGKFMVVEVYENEGSNGPPFPKVWLEKG